MPVTLSEDLRKIRREIDVLDRRILKLLEARAERALKVGTVKRVRGVPSYDPAREERVIERLVRRERGLLPRSALAAIYREIISACRGLQGNLRLAAWRPEGRSAALEAVGASSVVLEFSDLEGLFRSVERGEADLALLPFEEGSAGAWPEALDWLTRRSLRVWGEVRLPPSDPVRRLLLLARVVRPPSPNDQTLLAFHPRRGFSSLIEFLRPFVQAGVSCRRLGFSAGPEERTARAWGAFAGRPAAPPFARALHRAERACTFVKVLGSYPIPVEP